MLIAATIITIIGIIILAIIVLIGQTVGNVLKLAEQNPKNARLFKGLAIGLVVGPILWVGLIILYETVLR